ncbi:MAG: methyltransferase domain-containing protein [Verrucomicrobium sp.]|nr:methyltransferase domain-containing protein [Verrucomicrobium sp.]
MQEACDFDYIYAPLTPYRAEILRFVERHVPEGASVLDLGCGAVGFYWALGYLRKAAALRFADRNEAVLAGLAARLDQLTPAMLERDFADVPPSGLSRETWLEKLHAVADVAQIDALEAGEGTYGALLAVELLECAQDEEELRRIASFCAARLVPGGRLIGCTLDYVAWTPSLEALARERLAGRVRIEEKTLRQAIEDAGLKVADWSVFSTGMENHPRAYFFCAEKPA